MAFDYAALSRASNRYKKPSKQESCGFPLETFHMDHAALLISDTKRNYIRLAQWLRRKETSST